MDPTQRIDLRPPRRPTVRIENRGRPVIDVPAGMAPQPGPRLSEPGLLGDNGPGPLTVAWRDRWYLLIIALCTASLTYWASMQIPRMYAAETTMAFPYAGSEVALTGGDAERSRSLRTEAERITSLGLLQQAAESIGGGLDAEDLTSQVQAIPTTDADVVTVRAVAGAPRTAAEIANAVAAAYRRQVDQRQQRSINDLKQQRRTLEQRVSNQQTELAAELQDAAIAGEAETSAEPAVAASRLALEASVSQLSDVQARLDEVTAQQESAIGNIQVLRPAEPPNAPEQPRPLRNAATMVVLALTAFTTVRWWRADPEPPEVRDAQTVEALLGTAVIAEIPDVRRSSKVAGVVTDSYPHVVDAYRMAAAMTPIRGAILLTAARRQESCSDVVLNVGVILNRDGYRTILVEGDPQTGRLGPPLNSEREAKLGLTDLATGYAALDDCLQAGASADNAGMGFVPWGRELHALPRGEGSTLTHAVDELRAVSDLVLIDGPPLASSADALNLATNVDGLLVVVSLGTPLADLSRVRARLSQLDRPVLGVVLRHAPRSRRARRRRRLATTPVRWRPPSSVTTSAADR